MRWRSARPNVWARASIRKLQLRSLQGRFVRLIIPLCILAVPAAVIVGAIVRGKLFPTDTTTVYNVLYDVGRSLLALLVIILVMLLFRWLSTDDPDIVVVPFEVTTKDDKLGGRAVSDSLIAELQRIRRIHDQHIPGVDHVLPAPYNTSGAGTGGVRMSLARLATVGTAAGGRVDLAPTGEVSAALDNIGTIALGDTKIAIGPLLAVLRALWPLGVQSPTLRGTAQRYEKVVRLVARLEHPHFRSEDDGPSAAVATAGTRRRTADNKVLSWEVSDTLASDDALPALVQTLAYQIAHRLPPASQEASWLAFRRYTEAREAYLRYRQTRRTAALEEAAQHCLQAAAEEPHYQNNWLLLALVAQTLANEEQFGSAEQALKDAIRLAPRAVQRAGFCVLLGNAYKMNGKFVEASAAFERAIRLQPENALFRNGVGYVYLRLNQPNDALAAFRWAVEHDDSNAAYHVALAGMYRRLGRDDEWAAELARARALGAGGEDENAYQQAYLASVAGDSENAVKLLRTALDTGSVTAAWLRYDPDLDFIREDKPFQELLADYSRDPVL